MNTNTRRSLTTWLLDFNILCNTKNVFLFAKGYISRAFIEVFFSLFFLEGAILFTYISRENKSIEAGVLIKLFFIPLLIALSACILYSIFIIAIFFYCFAKGGQKVKVDENYKTKYELLNKYLSSVFKRIHILGVCFYFLASFFLAYCIFLSFDKEPSVFNILYNKREIVTLKESSIIIICVGTLFGVLWNLQDYYIDRSLKLDQMYLVLNERDCPDEFKLKTDYEKFRSYIIYVSFHIVVLLGVSVTSILGFYKYITADNFVDNLEQLLGTAINLGAFSFIITSFIAIISFYIRNIIKLSYSKNQASTIYFTFYDIML